MRPLTKILEGPNAERYLPYAKGRLDDLDRIGAPFLSDVSFVGDAEIQVKRLGDHDYIRIVVGGMALFTRGFVAEPNDFRFLAGGDGGFRDITRSGRVLDSEYFGAGYFTTVQYTDMFGATDHISGTLFWSKNGKDLGSCSFSWGHSTFHNNNAGEFIVPVSLGMIDGLQGSCVAGIASTRFDMAWLNQASLAMQRPIVMLLYSDRRTRLVDVPIIETDINRHYKNAVVASRDAGKWIVTFCEHRSVGEDPERETRTLVATTDDAGASWNVRYEPAMESGWYEHFDRASDFGNGIWITRSGAILCSRTGKIPHAPDALVSTPWLHTTRLFRSDNDGASFVETNIQQFFTSRRLRIESLVCLRKNVLLMKLTNSYLISGGFVGPWSNRNKVWWLRSIDDGVTWAVPPMAGFPAVGAEMVGVMTVTDFGASKSVVIIPVWDAGEGAYYEYASHDDGNTWKKRVKIIGAERLFIVPEIPSEPQMEQDNFRTLYLTRWRGKAAPLNIVTPWQTGEAKKPEPQT